jgi:hypothetical protein
MQTSDILFTRQTHHADRAGKHYDVRLVAGDKAYSFATKKELPEVGQSIILWEQPVHTSDYALRESGTIEKDQYGAGSFKLDFVRKAKLEQRGEGHFTLSTSKGEKYLLKAVPKFGDGAWLFKRLEMEKKNKYLEKIAIYYEIPAHSKSGKVPTGKVYHQYQLEAFSRGMRPTDKRLIILHRNESRWEH